MLVNYTCIVVGESGLRANLNKIMVLHEALFGT